MKKQIVNFLSLAMIIAAPSFLMTSCESDPCKDVTCEDGGLATESEDGKDCACVGGATSIEGKTFLNAESCDTTGSASYNVPIVSTSVADEVLFTGFGGYTGVDVKGVVAGLTVTVASQTVGGYTVSGTGTISADGKSITFSYTITDSANKSEGCDGTWTVI